MSRTLTITILLVSSLSMGARAQDRAQPQAPAADTGVTVADDFIIGPEDVLGIQFWREQDMSGDVTVRPDGLISVPLLGEVRAAGLRPDELKSDLQKRASKFLTDANLTIVVRQVNSRKVFITGEVAKPGAYPLTGPRTVMQLIALAGGLTEFADAKSIAVMRDEQGRTKTFKFNYRDVSRGRSVEQNILLQPGDTVVVR